jgi:hypothetical protein
MGLNWIPMQEGTPGKPEVGIIARFMEIDRANAFLLLFKVWCWADVNGRIIEGNSTDGDCHVARATIDEVDHAAGVTGMSDAMIEAGWLVADEHGLTFPRGERLMTKTAKERLSAAKRQDKHRKKKPRADSSVTDTSRNSRDKSVTTEHNITEHKNTPYSPPLDSNGEDVIEILADDAPGVEQRDSYSVMAEVISNAVAEYRARPDARRITLPTGAKLQDKIGEKLIAEGVVYHEIVQIDADDIAESVDRWQGHIEEVRRSNPKRAAMQDFPVWGLGYLPRVLTSKADRLKTEQVKQANDKKRREAREAEKEQIREWKAYLARVEAAWGKLNPTAQAAMMEKYQRGVEPPRITHERWYQATHNEAAAAAVEIEKNGK